jgi:RNA polymerase sigma factor (TIGR02999 family)
MQTAPAKQPDITQLLQAAGGGSVTAAAQVYEHLYADLRRIARARLAHGADLSLLGTTALVNEAFLRLWGGRVPAFNDTEHFLAYAARTMRSVVVDLVRARQAACRGGDAEHTVLDTLLSETLAAPDEEVLGVDEAMAALERSDPRLARVVELRYFAGLADAEVAAVLGVAERTVQRDWTKARLFLAQVLKPGGIKN